VQQCGGELSIHSDGIGKGTTVSFWTRFLLAKDEGAATTLSPPVPCAAPPSVKAEGAQPCTQDNANQNTPPTSQREISHLNILFVEDVVVNLKLGKAMIERMGHSVRTAMNGQEALAVLQSAEPYELDCVFMDMNMPVMDGPTAVKRLREWEAEADRPHLTVYALTGLVTEADRQMCLDAGCDGFIPKPFLPKHVNVHLETVAQAKAARLNLDC